MGDDGGRKGIAHAVLREWDAFLQNVLLVVSMFEGYKIKQKQHSKIIGNRNMGIFRCQAARNCRCGHGKGGTSARTGKKTVPGGGIVV